MSRSAVSAGAALALVATVATATTTSYTPLAFGPLGTTNSNQYFTSITDISADGTTFAGLLNTGAQILRTPSRDYTVQGTGGIFRLNPAGTIGVGGLAGQIPQRWDLASAGTNTITSTNITWPGGPLALGPAYATNADGTVFNTLTPRLNVITPTGRLDAQLIFQSINIGATAGAWRGLAPNEPIVTLGAVFPGDPANSYRWNYETNELQPLQSPAGGNGSSLNSTNAVTYDGRITIGTTFIGGNKPFWWDEQGVPHAIPLLPGSVTATTNAMNYTGTLIGGANNFGGSIGNRAYLYSRLDGTLYDLNQIYSDAGLLPAGWILTFTQHISDDGSKVFCDARAPDGTTRTVVLEADFIIPSPSALATLALGGLIAARRRR